MRFSSFVAALAAFVVVQARRSGNAQVTANPVRKVVTMLTAMQNKIMEEGEREEKLYEKFVCYCKSAGVNLDASISDATDKEPGVFAEIEASQQKLEQAKGDLMGRLADKSAAKEAMAEATAIRDKGAAAFAAERADYDANIAAIKAAIKAITRGMAGSFLQTNEAQVLRQLALGKHEMLDSERQALLSFLSSNQQAGYVPKSQEIVGILTDIMDRMQRALAEIQEDENKEISTYEDLMAAKGKELKALEDGIQAKTTQVGDLGMKIVQLKADLTDTEAAMLEDKNFMANLQKSCATKSKEWEERKKLRSEELLAIAETIKILNEDDAADLFKKTMPSSSTASFVQVTSSARANAMEVLGNAREASTTDRPKFDFLVLALGIGGKAQGRGTFDKVIKMIDSMVKVLEQEQVDDNHKKEYCFRQLDFADDKKKDLEKGVADAETAIDMAQEALKSIAEEIATLQKGITELDKQVAEATATRMAENKEYKEMLASTAEAKKLLGLAKDRLAKFYNPPAVVEATEEVPPLLVEINKHKQHQLPETWSGAYSGKKEDATPVLSMLDRLMVDLDKDVKQSEVDEKDAQAEYETAMKDSAEKRVVDSRTITDKLSVKADLETGLQEHKERKLSTAKELMAAMKYIQSLHAECDFLLQYFDIRKQARTGEIDSLQKAKTILSGTELAMLQAASRGLNKGA